MLTDRQIHVGMYELLSRSGTTPERLREMGHHATIGYQKPAAKVHWIMLPWGPEGHLWVGMRRKTMERCVILGGIPTRNKPNLGTILKTTAKNAIYAYEGKTSEWYTIQRNKKDVILYEHCKIELEEDGEQLLMHEIKTGKPAVTLPNKTKAKILEEEVLMLSIPGLPDLWLANEKHSYLENPFKSNKDKRTK